MSGGNLDPRFDAYVSIYNNLDTLLWGVPALLVGGTIAGIGLFGGDLATGAARLDPLSHEATLGVAFAVIACMYGLGAFGMYRLRHHHTVMGRKLRDLEGADGYFGEREKSLAWWKSAPHWFIIAFSALAVASLGASVCYFRADNDEGREHMATISPDDARSLGITTSHESMENREMRFRLMATDGSAYIRTVAGASGAWQNSHLHRNLRETYIVQSGWMVLVELRDGKEAFLRLLPGEVASTTPGVAHNVYLPGGAVIHTVKHGATVEKDWVSWPELDALTKALSERELLQKVKN